MSDQRKKERFLGSYDEGLGWKIYGFLPLLFCVLAIVLVFAAFRSKASENDFLNSATTERANGQVTEILADWVSPTHRSSRNKLGKPVVTRVGSAISTRITKWGAQSEHEHLNAVRFTSIVDFATPDGMSYTFEGGWRDGGAAHVPGEFVEVLYDSNEPSRAVLSSNVHDGSMLASIFAPISLALAGLLFYFNRKRIAKKRKLFDQGTIVDAIISDVVVDKKTSGNDGEHPIRLIATWTDAQHKTSRTFTSAPVFKEYDHRLIDETVEVVMVPDDPETYHVDTTFLDKRRAA